MQVTTCNYNNISLDLDLELSSYEFNQSEDVIKEKILDFANELLLKFGQSKNLVLSKYKQIDEDNSILCIFLVENKPIK